MILWQVLQNNRFARLFYATLLSESGSRIHRVALLFLVYTMTGDSRWLALALALQLAVTVVLGPFLAAWADGQERRRLLVLSDLLRAPLVLAIPLWGSQAPAVLLMLLVAIELLRNLHDPVTHAVIPELVTTAQLDAANGLMLFTQRLAEVAFVGLAGLLVAAVGPQAAFWLDALSYLASGVLLLGLPQLPSGQSGHTGYWVRVQAGLRWLFGQPLLRRTIITLFAAALFGSVEAVLGVVLAVQVLQVGSTGFGVLEAAMALGAVLSTLLAPTLSACFVRERLFLGSLLAFGLVEAAIGALPRFAWVLVAYFLAGGLNMLFLIPARAILQLNTPPELRGRVFAAFGTVMQSAVILGMLLGSVVEKPLGAPIVFLLAGLLVAAVALWAQWRGWRSHHSPGALAIATGETT